MHCSSECSPELAIGNLVCMLDDKETVRRLQDKAHGGWKLSMRNVNKMYIFREGGRHEYVYETTSSDLTDFTDAG